MRHVSPLILCVWLSVTVLCLHDDCVSVLGFGAALKTGGAGHMYPVAILHPNGQILPMGMFSSYPQYVSVENESAPAGQQRGMSKEEQRCA